MTVDKNVNLVKSTADNDFSDVQELVKGFDRAVITHALREQPENPDNLQMCKMVILYNHHEMSFEDVVRGAGDIMKYQFFSLVKNSVFNIVGKCLKKTSINYKSILFRTVLGFAPNVEDVNDQRACFSQYLESMKGGKNGKV